MASTPTNKNDAAKVNDADADKDVAAPLRLKEFVDLVAETSGVNRREVRPVLEAALGILHGRLQPGQVLVLPPLGRLRVVRDEGGVRTIKLRDVALAGAARAARDPLAGIGD